MCSGGKTKQDVVSPTLTKHLFPTPIGCNTFLSSYPVPRYWRRGFPPVYMSYQWDVCCPFPCGPFMTRISLFLFQSWYMSLFLKSGGWSHLYHAAGFTESDLTASQWHSQEAGLSSLLFWALQPLSPPIPQPEGISSRVRLRVELGKPIPLCCFKRLFIYPLPLKNRFLKIKNKKRPRRELFCWQHLPFTLLYTFLEAMSTELILIGRKNRGKCKNEKRHKLELQSLTQTHTQIAPSWTWKGGSTPQVRPNIRRGQACAYLPQRPEGHFSMVIPR